VGEYVVDQQSHGFLLSGGTYTTLDVPGVTFTAATGINDAGQIVGSYIAADGNFHGFLLSEGIYTLVDVPGATSTFIYGINNAGQIVGSYDGHGFLATPAAVPEPSTLTLLGLGLLGCSWRRQRQVQ
jgi:probable HAF family extracellular repeat protein